MSTAAAHLFLFGSGFLVAIMGLWLWWRGRRLLTKNQSRETVEVTVLVMWALWMLATAMQLAFELTTDIGIDSLSARYWWHGGSPVLSLFCSGVFVGLAVAAWRWRRPASGETQRPVGRKGALARVRAGCSYDWEEIVIYVLFWFGILWSVYH